jgi:nitrate/nitrite-specific signal transduction histidine kinase
VPTAIILAAVALVSLYAYQRVTENLVIERDRELTHLSARLLASELAAYTDPVGDRFLAIFDAAILFDPQGNLLATEPPEYETSMSAQWLDKLALHKALTSKEPVFSDVVQDRLHGEDIIVVAIPFSGQESGSVGGIAGVFRLSAAADSLLATSIEELRRSASNCIYLVDGNGQVIYHSDRQFVGQDFSTRSVVKLVLDGWSGAHRTRDLSGHDVVASFSPVPGTPWGLVTEENWAALVQPSRRYGQLLLLLLVLGIAVPTVIVTIGVNRITQPIQQVIGAAQEIAGGHFGGRITASTGDEMEELARQFNRMASQLQESYAQLEQKVADRTKELATLNAVAAQVSHSLDLDDILQSALDQVLATTGMDAGQACRVDEASGALQVVAQRHLSETYASTHRESAPCSNLSSPPIIDGDPVVVNTVDLPRGDLRDCMKAEGLQMTVGIPLIAQGRPVGALTLASRSPRTLTSDELSLLVSIGHQIGVAVDNAHLYEQAQQLAVIKERNRLARDLHDSVTQALYGVSLYSEAAARQLASGDAHLVASHLSEIRCTAQESLREMRLLIFELRLPKLKIEGLTAAIQTRLDAVESKVGMETALNVEGDGHLAPEVEEGLYRIAQEALNNTLRHAHANSVAVRLHYNNRTVTLEIIDDGIGFDPKEARTKGGFGLRGMEERAARLGAAFTMTSSPGRGTRIKVKVSR